MDAEKRFCGVVGEAHRVPYDSTGIWCAACDAGSPWVTRWFARCVYWYKFRLQRGVIRRGYGFPRRGQHRAESQGCSSQPVSLEDAPGVIQGALLCASRSSADSCNHSGADANERYDYEKLMK